MSVVTTPQQDNHSSLTRLLTLMVLSLGVVVLIAGMLFRYANAAKAAALDAKKQSELSSLHRLISSYYTLEDSTPENHSGEKTCIIGKRYDDKECLRELARDGYGNPPISPNDDPYLYYDDEEMFFVASRMQKELSPDKRCPHSNDPKMWCKVFKKT